MSSKLSIVSVVKESNEGLNIGMTMEDIVLILESFEGKRVHIKTSFEGIIITMEGTLRCASFAPIIYKVANDCGVILFPSDKVTMAFISGHSNFIELVL